MVSILSNGTSGDINNINFRQRSSRRWAPYEKMQQVADLIARRVLETHQNLKHKDWVPIQSLQQEITLRARKPDATLRNILPRLSSSLMIQFGIIDMKKSTRSELPS